ncbi:hypothetical protein MTO96_004316 [Rhipicephalus appendiculatus]
METDRTGILRRQLMMPTGTPISSSTARERKAFGHQPEPMPTGRVFERRLSREERSSLKNVARKMDLRHDSARRGFSAPFP